jgi:hypothetical protein
MGTDNDRDNDYDKDNDNDGRLRQGPSLGGCLRPGGETETGIIGIEIEIGTGLDSDTNGWPSREPDRSPCG